jgi:ABC-type phosphate transport system substrate-binding protein
MAGLRVLVLTLATLLTTVTGVKAEILIIVNADNPTKALSSRQVVDLYMGRYQNFPNGEPAFPLDLSPNSHLRERFYQRLTNKSIAEVNAYWARLLFTGRATPPRVLADPATVVRAVRENRGAIGYIDSADLDDGVKVVGRVD